MATVNVQFLWWIWQLSHHLNISVTWLTDICDSHSLFSMATCTWWLWHGRRKGGWVIAVLFLHIWQSIQPHLFYDAMFFQPQAKLTSSLVCNDSTQSIFVHTFCITKWTVIIFYAWAWSHLLASLQHRELREYLHEFLLFC